MEQKFIRAFKYVFTQNNYEQGFRYKLVPKDVVTCTIFFARGFVEAFDAETNTKGEDGFVGRMFKDADFIFKEYNCHAVEPTVVYCYDELMNGNQKLDLLPIDLPQGQSAVFENGTQFLLCDGVLHINNVPFTAPSAISIATGDKVVVPETRCLGLKIA